MAEVLEKIYDVVTEKTGYMGRMRLAVKTGVSRNKAVELPDNDELYQRFKKAASEILQKNIEEFLTRR